MIQKASCFEWVPEQEKTLKQVCHASCSDTWTTEPMGPITLEVEVAGRHDVWRLWKALVCDSQGRFLGCGRKVMLSSADNYFPLRNNNSFGLSAGRWWRQNAPDHRTLHYYMTWATHCKRVGWGGTGGDVWPTTAFHHHMEVVHMRSESSRFKDSSCTKK